MKTLTEEQAYALRSFVDAFEIHTTGVWRSIEAAMCDEFDIPDPESALEDAMEALRA